jgi:fatty-acyl-CoA synthase
VIDGKRYAFIGDMGTIETDGTLKVLGRGSGCINTAGEKVFPEEVEKILARHPDVADCLVIGVPDERFGQSVAAIVATRNHEAGLETQLVQFCREHLAAYKCPRQFRFRDSVERGPNGKPDYGWARGLFSS